MILEDLNYIFEPQIADGTTSLYFMLVDTNTNTILRHLVSEIENLLPMLDNFYYAGASNKMPKFTTFSLT